MCRNKRIRQGYLANTSLGSVRVRIAEREATLNIKSMTIGASRTEYEYPTPVEDAEVMLNKLCTGPLLEKTRFYLEQGRHTWEIDVFEGENTGLIVAEIELAREDEIFIRPDWLGEEVTDDERYYNVSLLNNPYSLWKPG